MNQQHRTFPKLFLVLGAGGVGKTTLAASLALALAAEGEHVGLLSIDPAKRLHSALGVEQLDDQGQELNLPGYPATVRAATLRIDECFRRWIEEQSSSKSQKESLFSNPLYQTLVNKLGTANDSLAAARLGEWLEHSPELTCMVVDTAPGVHALDFLSKGDRLLRFLNSPMITWMQTMGGKAPQSVRTWTGWVQTGSKRIWKSLASLGGESFIKNMSQLLVELDGVFTTMVRRLRLAEQWIHSPQTVTLIVCSPRADSVDVAGELVTVLGPDGKKVIIVNRCVHPTFTTHLPQIAHLAKQDKTPALSSFYNFANHTTINQHAAIDSVQKLGQRVVQVPLMAQLGSEQAIRTNDLCLLGQHLLRSGHLSS
jgi:anion-transporting  ArsA/GET3 family ATPase